MKYTYTPSKLLPGDGELLRERAFTKWLSPDLHQAAANFLINLGLAAIYAECAPDNSRRNILWHPPERTFEFRSGRSLESFVILDNANIERSWPLLTLHINEAKRYPPSGCRRISARSQNKSWPATASPLRSGMRRLDSRPSRNLPARGGFAFLTRPVPV